MQGTPDIAVTTTDGRRLALVEVKNLPKLSLGNATDLRDALVEQLPRPAMYVLVVSQDRGFMWRHQDQGAAYGEPEVLDMRPVLREYLSERELDRHIRGTDLELVVSHWLGELSRGRVMRPAGMSADGPFSQFVSDIRGAQVNLEALA